VEALEAASARLAPLERSALARAVPALEALAAQLGSSRPRRAAPRLPKRTPAR
jgi:hypothetical protein